MVIILSTPPTPPPVPVSQWRAASVEWFGADGSYWDLVSGAQGVVLQETGTEGMHDPVLTRFLSESRGVPGHRVRWFRAPARDVFWPVQVYSDASSEEWRDRYSAFFGSFHPVNTGTWRVGVDGVFRELDLVGKFSDAHAFGIDPLVRGWEQFGLKLEAPEPFWRGDVVSRGPWTGATRVDFFDPSGSPDFHISSGATFESAAMPNPGDVDAYPVWTIVGPLEDITVGVGGLLVEVPFDLADGEVLRIDTDPRNVTALLDGVDCTTELGFQSFASVPPGVEVSLDVAAVGAGSITAELVPLYFRAF